MLRIPIQHPFTTAHFGDATGQIKLHVLFVVDRYQPPLQKPASTLTLARSNWRHAVAVTLPIIGESNTSNS